MTHFNEYSKYYDLLYRDKDYLAEVNYIDCLIKKNDKVSSSVLDVGCGTGRHANLMVEKGYKVHGIDQSDNMLDEASKNFGNRVKFSQGDIRSFDLGISFDVITSLFHVMSYQTKNEDLELSFKTVYNHLNPNGYFIFDCWYGPGVLSELPSVRIKRMKDTSIEVIRIAEPEIHYCESVVEVNYQILISDLETNYLTRLSEKHSMRYLFRTEIEFLAKKYSMEIVGFYSWLTFREPTKNDWYAVFVLKK